MLMQEEGQDSSQESNWQYSGASDEHAGADMAESTGVPMQKIPEVNWSASEYVSHEKDAAWYAALIGATIALVAAVFLITGDVLASLAVLIAGAAMTAYAGRKPGTKNYIVDESGIKINEEFHPYSEFKSFSVVEEGAINSIWLKPIKRFAPMVIIYFEPTDEQKIIDVLANFLPHEDRQLDPIDRFTKRIRF